MKGLSRIFITLLLALSAVSLGAYLLVSRPRMLPTDRLAQEQVTPISMEAVSTAVVATAAVPLPTPDVEASEGQQGYDPDPTTTYTDAFPMPVPPTPIPTPDVHVTTVPELDRIAFVNPRPLQLPMKDHVSFGAVAWSPESQRYVGTFPSSESFWIGDLGWNIFDLYMGDANTGALALWQHNGGWPAWSRDGRSVYYLALRSDGQRFYFDLYRRAVDSEEGELIVQDVGAPYLPQPAAVETGDGRLLMLNREHQPALLHLADEKVELLSLASLLSLSEIAGQKTFFSLAPDGHTVAVIPYGGPFFILDLATNQIVAELNDVADYYRNVAWSADGRRLAYASRNGVFIYNLPTGQVQALVTRQDLGFPENDPRSGFGDPVWSPDERVILFHAGTPDWRYQGTSQGNCRSSFLFAATSDGSHWKALSCYFLDSMAPGGSQAIVSDWDPEAQRETKYLVDVVWK